jgi:hypothetical protein
VSVEVLVRGVERHGSEQAAQALDMSLEETTSWKNDPNMRKEQRSIVPPTCAQWLSDDLEAFPAWQRAPIHGSGSVRGGLKGDDSACSAYFANLDSLVPFKSARHMINQTITHLQIHHAMRLAKSRRPSLFELLISTREISQIVQADVHSIPNSWTLVLVWFVI